jgi:hypothetical protein
MVTIVSTYHDQPARRKSRRTRATRAAGALRIKTLRLEAARISTDWSKKPAARVQLSCLAGLRIPTVCCLVAVRML